MKQKNPFGEAKYGGKTYLSCSLIFGNALIYPETHYFIARKALMISGGHTPQHLG
jgi:hypothetical protein